jgi:hypothetical protein
MQINDILLAQNIHRWTIVATTREQSLAEHLFNVTMIARDIACELDIDDSNVIKYALDHDLDEIMTGDIPSPAKSRMGIKDIYDGKGRGQCNEIERLVVKAADLIDSYQFIKHHRIGHHGDVVYMHVCNKFEEWLRELKRNHPVVEGAVSNTVAMIEFGKYETEMYDE